MAKATPIRNVHTGDWLKSKAPTDEYRSGWDRTFGKKPQAEEEAKTPDPDVNKNPS